MKTLTETTLSPTTLLTRGDHLRIEFGQLDGVTAVQHAANEAGVALPIEKVGYARWQLRMCRTRRRLDALEAADEPHLVADPATPREVLVGGLLCLLLAITGVGLPVAALVALVSLAD